MHGSLTIAETTRQSSWTLQPNKHFSDVASPQW